MLCHQIYRKLNYKTIFHKKELNKYCSSVKNSKNLYRNIKQSLSNGELDIHRKCIKEGSVIPLNEMQNIKQDIFKWATFNGATKFMHQFQPLSGHSAGKIESLWSPHFNHSEEEGILSRETDGSSFSNGGLRTTDKAKSYTIADFDSRFFIKNNTLYIPSMLFSYQGYPLDNKTLLLRSNYNLSSAVENLIYILGIDYLGKGVSHCGVEQEFFLLDKKYIDTRLDLRTTGRTLLGHSYFRGQKFSDHYFGSMSPKIEKFFSKVEQQANEIGINFIGCHGEVAPNQYEVVTKYDEPNQASDDNRMLMNIIYTTANKMGMQPLFHEKPFQDLNGSGKHINWSIGSILLPNFFKQKSGPDNHLALLFFAITLSAINANTDLIRYGVNGAGNDHRLGGHEAPPAIISVSIGEKNELIIQEAIAKNNFDILYKLDFSNIERNRTSPICFTGNKFEFRSVGSSQSPAFFNCILNTIIVESIERMSREYMQNYTPYFEEEALKKTILFLLKKSQRIIYNKNCYSNIWKEEAIKRGLPNYCDSNSVFSTIGNLATFKPFLVQNIYSNDTELNARLTFDRDQYIKTIILEANVLVKMVADICWAMKKCKSPNINCDQLKKELKIIENMIKESTIINNYCQMTSIDFISKKLLPSMQSLRIKLSKIESPITHSMRHDDMLSPIL